ncbi:uncharacterized protein EDB91DRAFT_1051121 [Suillus paluster]|uniref:uncharacterized protein n=1 Tax=Suillus paluster TaxID=48578 RepID=UPI001B8641F5|nr:uncharacterized protein EDB91DRAFT_1051121 [Suillus paluster]KAG1743734.1 hypothetical protein EDB91DRAFT_1051121 [Suillus paluster]
MPVVPNLLPCPVAHRIRIASLISPLRRVRPRTPFYELSAHRVPTLWSLYRGLLRHAPGENASDLLFHLIRFRVRMLFRKNQHVVKAHAAKEQLVMGYKWLESFKRAEQGDIKLQNLLNRYERMIATKCEKTVWKMRILEAFNWEAKLRKRPIFKGSFIRPSFEHNLLPRLIPQPAHITGMIVRRRVARVRRWEQRETLRAGHTICGMRVSLSTALLKSAQGEAVGAAQFTKGRMLEDQCRPMCRGDCTSKGTPLVGPSGKQARRDRIANKTAQRQRERSGEVTTATIKRRRNAPPAHIQELMTPRQILMDRAVREASEGGWSGTVKARMGVHMHMSEKWKAEGGWEDQKTKKRLDDMEREIRVENERRRKGSQLDPAPLSE